MIYSFILPCKTEVGIKGKPPSSEGLASRQEPNETELYPKERMRRVSGFIREYEIECKLEDNMKFCYRGTKYNELKRKAKPADTKLVYRGIKHAA